MSTSKVNSYIKNQWQSLLIGGSLIIAVQFGFKLLSNLSTDQHLKLLQTATTAVCFVFLFRVLQKNKSKEIKFKAYKQKKHLYEEFFNLYAEFATFSSKKKSNKFFNLMGRINKSLLQLSQVASKEIMEKIMRFKKLAKLIDGNSAIINYMLLITLADIIASMRRESGIDEDDDVTVRDILSLTVPDITEKDFDCLFELYKELDNENIPLENLTNRKLVLESSNLNNIAKLNLNN